LNEAARQGGCSFHVTGVQGSLSLREIPERNSKWIHQTPPLPV
jgi:hypothetical protein